MHSDYTVTGRDGVIIVNNFRQQADYTGDCVATVLLAVNNSDYTVTVQSLCSHCA